MRAAFVLSLLVLIGGCSLLFDAPGDGHRPGENPTDAVFRTDRAVYAPGQTAELRLNNSGSEHIGYNLCLSELKALTPDGTAPADGLTCTMILLSLAPGEQATFGYPLSVRPGTYRFTTTIEHIGGRRQTLSTPPFEVRR